MSITRKKIGEIVPAEFRNNGGSFGLEYPFIYGHDLANWLIWHRHTGEIVHIENEPNPALAEHVCRRRCEEMNAVPPMSAETLAAIDMTP